jgi:hypothetical protein
MKSSKPGKTISACVEGITPFGLWLLLGEKEYFLSFEEFPYFQKQPIEAVQNVRVFHGFHLHWPDLDVDLEIDNFEHPERYPLKSRLNLPTAGGKRKSANAR